MFQNIRDVLKVFRKIFSKNKPPKPAERIDEEFARVIKNANIISKRLPKNLDISSHSWGEKFEF